MSSLKFIFSTSYCPASIQIGFVHASNENFTLITSLSLQWITTKRRLPIKTLDQVIVHTLSVSEGRSVGKLVGDELHEWSWYCGGEEKERRTPPAKPYLV